MEGDAAELLKQARRLNLEGFVGKRSGSIYEPGQRSGAWIKLKFHQEQELVIGGFTEPRGGRNYFGALLVGYYERRQLLCAGKVGTGFDDSSLKALSTRFAPLLTPACPFQNLPEKRSGRYGAGITAAEMRRCKWPKPVMVCQVKYGTRMDARRKVTSCGVSGVCARIKQLGKSLGKRQNSMKTNTVLQVGNVEIAVSNLDKVFYPKAGFTKGQVIDYYIRISEVLLPHLRARPITLAIS